MKVIPTKQIYKRLTQLSSGIKINDRILKTIVVPINDNHMVFETEDLMELAKEDVKDGIFRDMEMAIFAEMIYSFTEEDNEEFDLDEYLTLDITDEIFRHGKIFTKDDFAKNAYFNNIHFDEHRVGDYELGNYTIEAYELMTYEPSTYLPNGIEIPKTCIFNQDITFPGLWKKGEPFAPLNPTEIFVTEHSIEKAHGNVLVLGCNIGYFPYMVSLKNNVSHVTIIENRREVIDLFTKYILPQFEYQDKITIIHADAFQYIQNLQDSVFDYCFVDIFGDNQDLTKYIRMQTLCKKFNQMEVSYWGNDMMLSTFALFVQLIIAGAYQNVNICSEQNLRGHKKDDAYALKFLDNKLKDVTITRADQIDYYLDRQTIKKLIQ